MDGATWEFSDGTKFHLGGKVEGGSILAIILRQGVQDMREGRGPVVFLEPMPCGPTAVDMDNPQHVNRWVRSIANCKGILVLSAPDVAPIQSEQQPTRRLPNVVN